MMSETRVRATNHRRSWLRYALSVAWTLLAGSAFAAVTESVSWTLPTLVSTTLYLRDQTHVLALDLAR